MIGIQAGLKIAAFNKGEFKKYTMNQFKIVKYSYIYDDVIHTATERKVYYKDNSGEVEASGSEIIHFTNNNYPLDECILMPEGLLCKTFIYKYNNDSKEIWHVPATQITGEKCDTCYTYDSKGRIIEDNYQSISKDKIHNMDYKYIYDNNQIISTIETINDDNNAIAIVTDFTYDSNGNLICCKKGQSKSDFLLETDKKLNWLKKSEFVGNSMNNRTPFIVYNRKILFYDQQFSKDNPKHLKPEDSDYLSLFPQEILKEFDLLKFPLSKVP